MLHGRKSISWAKSVLPLFTSASSEIFRKVPDRVQIDTTLNRQNPVQNHAVTGRRSEFNRTAVVEAGKHRVLTRRKEEDIKVKEGERDCPFVQTVPIPIGE